MNTCRYCGEPIGADDQQCPHCGYPVNDESDMKIWPKDGKEEVSTQTHEEVELVEQPEQSEAAQEVEAQAKREAREQKIEEKKEQFKAGLEKAGQKTSHFLSEYSQYFMGTLKSPLEEGHSQNWYTGYVNFFLMMLMNTLPVLVLVNRINKTFKNTFTFFSVESGGFADEMAGSINWKVIGFFVLAYIILVGGGYLLLHLTTEKEMSIHDFANEFSALLTHTIPLSLVSLVLTLFLPLDFISVLIFLIALPIFSFIFALSYYLFEYGKESKISRYYLLLLGHLILVLALGLAYHFLLHNYFGHILNELL